ncbi:MAG TPA: carboxypeptidase-like regulatory domain-containing protein [Gemmata sp.]|jgi:hypothetical protein|nr:carboxypeptidase-like regulatory domain-containing protein [Gemmata sp.]
MSGRPLAGLLLALITAGPLLADDPKLPDVKAYDKLVVDSLRDVHNKGADLFNESKDFIGTYRMYQGALLTVRPLLAHQPAAQKLIDDGLAMTEKGWFQLSDQLFMVLQKAMVPEAVLSKLNPLKDKALFRNEFVSEIGKVLTNEERNRFQDLILNYAAVKAPTIAQKSFKLHETIEAVRALLKNGGEPTTKAAETKKPADKKPTEPTDTKKPTDKKPTQVYELAPQPREKKLDDSSKPKPISTTIPDDGKRLSGKVILRGQPLTAAEVTVVSLDQTKPQVFTAVVKADGSYTFTQPLPPGRYVVIVTAKAVPDKYQTTTTSGLTIEVKLGSANFDIDLK